ncbi:MAG: glycogen/starch synthase [Candidatus Neomarinimicrobiota bacterium]
MAKIFFLTTEITPFANTAGLGDFSAKVPLLLQEKGHDIRTIIPKYGFVSERKYILREVIRLREIPFNFDGSEHLASAKSAFIPKTRVQVYFLEHSEWFKPLSNLLYKSKNGRPYSDNDDRYAFFDTAALATLPHLFWKPNVIMCNDWQTAMVPLIYRQVYQEEEFYQGIKTILLVHSMSEYGEFSRGAFEKAGLQLPDSLTGDSINVLEAALPVVDKIIALDTPENNVSAELMKLNCYQDVEKKMITIALEDNSLDAYSRVANSIDQLVQEDV